MKSTGPSGKPTSQGLQDRTFLAHCVHLNQKKRQNHRNSKEGKTNP